MADFLYACDWIAALLFAGALAMTALTHKELGAAKLMIWCALALSIIRWTMWAFTTEQPWYYRVLIGAVIGGFLLAAIPASLKWIATREAEVIEPKAPIAQPRKSKTELKIEEANALAKLERQRNIAREKTAHSDFERHQPLAPATKPSPRSTPSVSVTNSPGSIIAPSGGVNTIINQAPPPGIRITEPPAILQRPDGSFDRYFTLEIVTAAPPGNLVIAVKGTAVTGVDVNPLTQGVVQFGKRATCIISAFQRRSGNTKSP